MTSALVPTERLPGAAVASPVDETPVSPDAPGAATGAPFADALARVAALVDRVLGDTAPPPMIDTALLAIEVPLLIAALDDTALGRDPDHPVQRLADRLAQLADILRQDPRAEERVAADLGSAIDAAVDDGPLGLPTAAETLDRLLERERRLAEIGERRAAEAARGRERLEAARAAVIAALNPVLDTARPVPEMIEFLARHWCNVLVLAHLRQGPESTAWREAVRVAARLLVATHDLPVALAVAGPVLRRGLSAAGVLPSHVDAMLSALAGAAQQRRTARAPGDGSELSPREVIEAALRVTGGRTADREETPPRALAAMQSSALGEAARPARLAGLRLGALQPWLDTVRAARPGQWYDLAIPGRDPVRGKLAWMNVARTRFVFVNEQGLKVAEFGDRELVVALATGRATASERGAGR